MLRAPRSRRLGASLVLACVAILVSQAVTPVQAQTENLLLVAPSSLNFTLNSGDSLFASLSVYEQSGGAVEFWTYNYQNWLFIDTFSVAPLITPESLYIIINATGLNPGYYADTIIIDAYDAANTPLLVPVNLEVVGDSADYQVVANPPFFNLVLADGQVHVEYLDVYETHGAFVPFNVENSQPWILTSGYPYGPPYSTPATLEVVFVLDTMPVGTYYDTLVISPALDTMPFAIVEVPITVTVDTTLPGGFIRTEPTQFTFQLEQGDSIIGEELYVYEVGGDSLSFWAFNYGSWLQLDTAGTVPLFTPETLLLNVRTAGLAPGGYSDTIVVICYEAQNSPVLVPVNLFVTGGGTEYEVATAPTSMEFNLALGAIGYDSLYVYETHGYSVGFTYESPASWLTVEPLGQGPWVTPMTLLVSASSLQTGPGIFHDSIFIFPTTRGMDFPPVAVPVTMLVDQFAPILHAAPDHFSLSVAPGDSLLNLAMLVYEQYGYGVGFWIETQPGSDWLQVHYPDTLSPFWYTPDSVYFDVYAGDLTAGWYSDTIVIFDPLDDTVFFDDVRVPVDLFVTGEPEDFVVEALPPVFNFSLAPGESISDSLHVYEIHGRTVGFTHTNSQPWLVVNPFEMPPIMTPLTMPIYVNTDSLPLGYYTDTIFISPAADTTLFPIVAVPVNLVVGDSVLCGDVDDNGIINISDAVGVINYIFVGAAPFVELCRYDCNTDGIVNISDAVFLIQYVFGYRSPINGCCP